MDADHRTADHLAAMAAAIGEPSRVRMLYGLMDGHARTSTELSVIAEITASTASAHLSKLRACGLVRLRAQGKHRYYSLANGEVAALLERLQVLAGDVQPAFAPSTPPRLRAARTCYDHLAGAAGVSLHDHFKVRGWLLAGSDDVSSDYVLTAEGADALAALGVDVAAARAQRRRFACGCVDWSERRPHLAGALGAAVLTLVLRKRWLVQDADSRALTATSLGRRQFKARFGLDL